MAWMTPMMAAAAQEQQGETLLAELISKDTEGKYEYKILRGGPSTFRKPERLQAILEEERRSQWEMVVKLNDERLILRRLRRTMTYDAMAGSGTDPYRTQVGSSRLAAKMSIAILLGLLAMGALVAYLMAGKADTGIESASVPSIAAVVVAIAVAGLMAFVVALKRSR